MNRFNKNRKPSLLPKCAQLTSSRLVSMNGFFEQEGNYTNLAEILPRVTASALGTALFYSLIFSSSVMTTTTNYMDCLSEATYLPNCTKYAEGSIALHSSSKESEAVTLLCSSTHQGDRSGREVDTQKKLV